MIVKTISHYRILEKLGEGGMGMVYKAQDTKLNRTVALKFLPASLSTDQDARTRFIKEAQTASALDHPNICSIYEIGESEEGQSFIAMACYEGETLKDKIKDQRLKTEDSVNIVIQIAKGLARAHEEGIIHRDIKPANIMITKRGEVKILDFGLAKLAGQTRLTRTGTTLGTAAYMSPEQARGEEADQRSDIWSLGVVLYEMLTGELPFKGEFEQAMIYTIINEDPEALEGNGNIPDQLHSIVEKALAKDPVQRYQTVEELLEDFKPLSPEATLPVEIPLKKLATRFWQKHRLAAIISLGLLGILFILHLFREAIFPQSEKKPKIAVISFENMTGDQEFEYLANVVPNLLITGLGQSNLVQVLSWDYMRDILKQLDIRDTPNITSEMGYQICGRTDITALVTGSFTKVGNLYVTDVKVIDPQSKEILVPVSSKGEDLNSIPYQQIDFLSQAILEGLNASDSSYLLNKKSITEITTPSLQAYRYYVRGREETDRFNLNESTRFLRRAVELDSTFASAFYSLASTYYLSGQYESAQSAIAKAYRYIHRAAPTDRDQIEAYYTFLIEQNLEKMAEHIKAALSNNPNNKNLWLLYQYYFAKMKRPEERLDCIEKSLSIDPEFIPALNLAGYAYLSIGNKAKAIEYTEKYLMASPGDANTMHTAGEIYYGLGMLDESLEQFRELKLMYPEWNANFPIIYIHILQQHYDQAREELDNFIEEVPPQPTWKAFVQLYRSLFFYYMGEISQAFKELDSILKNNKVSPGMREKTYALWGYLLLDQNKITAAREAFWQSCSGNQTDPYWQAFQAMVCLRQEKLDSARLYLRKGLYTIRETSHPTDFQEVKLQFDVLRAEQLLAVDSIDQAIQYYNSIPIPKEYQDTQRFELVLPVNILYNIPLEKDIIPRALLKKGDLRRAIKAYEKLIKFYPDQKGRFIIHPVYHYRLAKLYEQDNQIKKAIDRYIYFIKVWKNADADIPELIDAQKKLNTLRMGRE